MPFQQREAGLLDGLGLAQLLDDQLGLLAHDGQRTHRLRSTPARSARSGADGLEPVSKPPAPSGTPPRGAGRRRRTCKGPQPELRPATTTDTTIRRPDGTDRF